MTNYKLQIPNFQFVMGHLSFVIRMADSSLARLHGIVTGSVQGVSFRAFTYKRANELGLVGFVRNLPDDSVEFVAEGSRDALADFRERVHVGPWMAVVENLDSEWGIATGEFFRFEIRY